MKTYYLTSSVPRALVAALRRRKCEAAYRGERIVARCDSRTLREAILAVRFLPTTWCIDDQPLAIAKEQWL